MKRYLSHLIRSAEIRVAQFLREQEKDPGRLMYGGIREEIWEAKPTIYRMADAVAVYVNQDSRYFHDETLYQAMLLAMQFVSRTQREDGSFDYPSCNFKSPADTAFCFKRLIGAYRLLVKYELTGAAEELKQIYRRVMISALPAISEGGFHTPNHRWGLTAALLQGANVFAQEPEFTDRLKERAMQYLAEGIDCDEDGEYAERSTGNYNAVVNMSLISIYEETKDEAYLDYVRRNLFTMLHYLDPDDTIFTQNSARQDRGEVVFADKYFYQYLYLCSRENHPVFDAAAHKIIKDNLERGDMAPECLHIVMLYDRMQNYEFKGYGFLDTYHKFFHNSGVLRVKRPNYTYTVMNNNTEFLFFKTGKTQVSWRIGESYCDIRYFTPQNIEQNGSQTILKGSAQGWYYLPFEEAPGTSDWSQMDHSKRNQIISSHIDLTVTVEEQTDGLEITVKAEGLDRLPLRIATCISPDSVLEHQGFWLKAHGGGNLILRNGCVDIHQGAGHLVLGYGFGEHEFQGHYSEPEQATDEYIIYCNAYTPCEKKLYIKVR